MIIIFYILSGQLSIYQTHAGSLILPPTRAQGVVEWILPGLQGA